MFVKINRINEKENTKELIVNLDEIAFLSQAEDHIRYDKPIEFKEEVDEETGEKVIDEETGEVKQIPVKWETEERFVLGFKNGKHPQFLDRANYEQLRDMLLK